MVKVLDIDALFDKYIEEYVFANVGKVKPEEIENKISELYVKFGDEKLKELDGFTPRTYYAQYSGEELLECLKLHLEKRVAVSDFLCETIVKNKENEQALILALNEENDEEFLLYLLNMLSEINSKACKDKLLDFVCWDYGEGVKEVATEQLCLSANDIKEELISRYNEAQQEAKTYLTEILSYVKDDERVFDILVKEFKIHQSNLPIYANYLVRYGDERALEYLLEKIEDTSISYADFEELRFAIEALGGTYDKKRDFTKDKTFRKIKGERKKF